MTETNKPPVISAQELIEQRDFALHRCAILRAEVERLTALLSQHPKAAQE